MILLRLLLHLLSWKCQFLFSFMWCASKTCMYELNFRFPLTYSSPFSLRHTVFSLWMKYTYSLARVLPVCSLQACFAFCSGRGGSDNCSRVYLSVSWTYRRCVLQAKYLSRVGSSLRTWEELLLTHAVLRCWRWRLRGLRSSVFAPDLIVAVAIWYDLCKREDGLMHFV